MSRREDQDYLIGRVNRPNRAAAEIAGATMPLARSSGTASSRSRWAHRCRLTRKPKASFNCRT